jgi:hypothetical protein
MSSLWQWVLIVLTFSGASIAIISGVIFLYLFAGFQYLKGFYGIRLLFS